MESTADRSYKKKMGKYNVNGKHDTVCVTTTARYLEILSCI